MEIHALQPLHLRRLSPVPVPISQVLAGTFWLPRSSSPGAGHTAYEVHMAKVAAMTEVTYGLSDRVNFIDAFSGAQPAAHPP